MVQVRQTTIVDAPVDEVWRVLRDFNGHDRWHPAVAASEIEHGDPSDLIGAVRHFRLADGGELREQLLSLSDRDRSFSYCILEAPFPLMGYVAHVRLKPVTDGDRTFWEWRSEFSPPAESRAALEKLVREGIYLAGFAAIRRLFGGQRGSAAVPPPLTHPHKGEGDHRVALGARDVGHRAGEALPAFSGGSTTALAEGNAEVFRQDGTGPGRSPSPLWGWVGGAGTEAGHHSPTTTERTRAILVERYGGPEVLQLKEIALPPPGPGEVRIRHTIVGVNFIDVYCRTGYFDLLKPPGVPGMEAAGVVEAVGENVDGMEPGDRVAYACPPVGAYAERRNMAPDLLVRLSPDIPDELAAASLLKGVSASFLLHDVFPVRSGQIVLVHAAAGGVGQLLVQWASALGATVIATVSTEDKAALAGRLGAQHAIVHGRENFADAVMRITGGRGADVVYDAVGNDTFAGSLASLAVRGHLVSFGQASGPVGNWDIGRFSSKSITVSRPNYGHYTDTPEKLGPHVERFFAAVRHGLVRVEPPRRYPLVNAADAHRDLESRRTTGSLVLVV
ncbi:MAG: zinc-binding dehydrogenase [Rhizobiaceae bacterium]|nr:zinc-binding dehydrogenase [Rhizobiaceae bacterium]